MAANINRELSGMATQLARLEMMPPQKRYSAIAKATPDFTAQLARARQDALLAWVDELTHTTTPIGNRGKAMTRAEAVSHIMAKTSYARSTVMNVLIAAERRHGRPKLKAGRPRTRGLAIAA